MTIEVEHTKRSLNFQRRIRNFCDRLRDVEQGREQLQAHEIEEIRYILENFTTDSDCIVKAADDEPIFVLLGHDISAGGEDGRQGVVDFWCELQLGHHLSLISWAMTIPPKVTDARECAAEMRAYPNRKWPD